MSNPVDPFSTPPERFPRDYSAFGQRTRADTHEIPTVSAQPPGSPPPPVVPQAPVPPPPPPKRRNNTVLAIVIGAVVLLVGVGVTAAFLLSGSDTSAAPEGGGESSSAPPSSTDAPSPSDEPSEAAEAPSMPTKLGAWWAKEGVYAAKWEEPKDNGGGEITGYVVGECEDGEQLLDITGADYDTARAEADDADGVFEIEFKAEKLKCVSVRAVNSAGVGSEATFDIEE